MSPLRSAILSALGATLVATPAFAWPTVDVTASEVLSVDPPRVRTTFEIGSSGYEPGCGLQYVEITPLDPQAVHIFACGAPAGWHCGEALPLGSGAMYFANPDNRPGLTFSIVTEQASPCMKFYYHDPLLARVPAPELNYR